MLCNLICNEVNLNIAIRFPPPCIYVAVVHAVDAYNNYNDTYLIILARKKSNSPR